MTRVSPDGSQTPTLAATTASGHDPIPRFPRRRAVGASAPGTSSRYTLTILDECERLSEPGAKGALLRRENLYSSHVVEWRRARTIGLTELGRPRGRKPLQTPGGVDLDRMRRRAERAGEDWPRRGWRSKFREKLGALEAISKSAEPDSKSKP